MILLAVLAVQAAAAIAPAVPASAPIETNAAALAPQGVTIVLAQDTPVELMAVAEVTTAKATPGTSFKLRVNRAVESGGRTIIPVGTLAYGEVITAKESSGLGKSGRMTARLRHIQLGDVLIKLDGDLSAKGTGAGSAGVAFLLAGWPALFHRGNNAKIKAGEIVAGFIGEDVPLDLSGATPRRVGTTPATAPLAP